MSRLKEFRQFNKPHRPNAEAGEFIYKIYELLFHQPGITLRTKQVTLETAAVHQYPWKIVCISEKALHHIATTEKAEGLRRAHPLQRAERAKKLFQRTKPLTYRVFMSYYFANDTVALVVADENNRHGVGHWSQLHEVPSGLLTGGSFSVRVSKEDIAWVNTVLARKETGAA
jgi:hypothetical protein